MEDGGSAGVCLDVHDVVHGIVEGVFGLAFPDAGLRARLGVRAISRIAGRNAGWYLWTAGRAGAIELSLPDGIDGLADGAVPLAVRYFPDPEEATFAQHSLQERAQRTSDRFDRTGTPAFAALADIDPSLFHVGVLELAPHPGARVDLRLHAQGRWVDEVEQSGRWVRTRDVPGLRIARVVLDTLACALAYVGRQSPARVRVWRQPGVIRRVAPDGSPILVPAGDFSSWLVEVGGLPVPGGFDASPGKDSPGVDAAPWFDHAARHPPARARWPVNAAWWHAAGWQFAPTGAFCGHCAAEAERGALAPAHDHAHCGEGDHCHAT